MWFQLPEGTTQISVAGQNFACNEDGKFEAPDEHEAALAAAGIMRTSPPNAIQDDPAVEETVEIEDPKPVEEPTIEAATQETVDNPSEPAAAQ